MRTNLSARMVDTIVISIVSIPDNMKEAFSLKREPQS